MEIIVGVVLIALGMVVVSAIIDGISSRRERLAYEHSRLVPNVPTSRPLPQGSAPIVRHDNTVHNAINTPGDDDDSMITSMAIGAMTGSALAGGMLGGDMLGGMIGASLVDDGSSSVDTTTSDDTCTTDSSSSDTMCDTSYDSSSNYSDSSSSDSGSSGGSDW